MGAIIKNLLQGTLLESNPCAEKRENDPIIIDGFHKFNGKYIPASFSLSHSDLSKHILTIGSIGSGKTNLINIMVDQLKSRMTEKDVMIIFDYKGDYYHEFYESERKDEILDTSHDLRSKSSIWNVFMDILADGTETEDIKANCDEIATSFFSDMKNVNTPFFTLAPIQFISRLMYSITLKCLRKNNKNNIINIPDDLYHPMDDTSPLLYLPTNAYLVSVIERFSKLTIKEMKEVIDQEFPEVKPSFKLSNPDSPSTFGSVFGEVALMLTRKFSNVFGTYITDEMRFSIRGFVKNRGGRTLFIERDNMNSNIYESNYCLLIDMAIKEVLGDRHYEVDKVAGKDHGNVYLVLDELANLPNLTLLSEALHAGRSKGLKIIAGLQNKPQLDDKYSKNESASESKSMLSGFSSWFTFYLANDEETINYVVNTSGDNIWEYKYVSGRTLKSEIKEGHTVESWDIKQLNVGESIVSLCPTVNIDENNNKRFPFIFLPKLYVSRKER